jgi:drug/metabolite transporter (DMT)-like permease
LSSEATPHSTQDTALRGIGLMVLAMLCVPMVDGVAKLLSSTYSPLFICWARYACATLLAVPLSVARSGRDFLPGENYPAHLLRTLFMVAAMICYFLAIASIPLADAISAYFVGPIIAMLAAVLLLGEKFTTHKLASLGLGFAGAMIIVQPGGAVEPGILLALASGILFAGYMIATRTAALTSDPVKTLAFQNIFGTAILMPLAIWTWPGSFTESLWLFGVMGLFSVTGHLLSILAFRFADASTLAPIVYVELIGSVAMGYFLFADWPGLSVWIGAAAIVAGGALLLRRPSLDPAVPDAH